MTDVALAKRKSEIRTRLAGLRARLAPADVQARSARIVAHLRGHASVAGAKRPMAYAACGPEPDPGGLVASWISDSIPVGFPRVLTPDGEMEAREVASLSHLHPGRWGLMEPDPAACPLADPAALDLLLVPGVAFDRRGNRLGRGKGFYDRFLENVDSRATIIGICYDSEILGEIPVDSDCDRPVAWLATPSGIVQCG